MKRAFFKARSPFGTVRGFLALLCALLVARGDPAMYAQAPQNGAAQEQAAPAPKIPNDQLDSLVAPIALYPDPLLAQMLAASTYPLEMVQLQQWLAKHKDLKDKALVDAVQKEDWDPSVQAMAVLPDAVKQLSENIKWTTDLGNAFLAQQGDVMDAVQRMRMKAQGAGALKSNERQKVETKVVESKTVVVIEQANPEIVYVPSYNPTVVYGPPVYPYPPIYYPPPPVGAYVATAAISFGVGMAVGAAMSGGWGWGCGWGHNNVTVNVNNNFVNNANRTNVNRGDVNRANVSSGNWQHDPQHRGGTPYSNRATASKYGGADRASSSASRQAAASQSRNQPGGRQAGAGDRASVTGRQQPGGASSGSGDSDRMGNRSVGGGSGSSRGGGAFGGGAGGSSGSSARASSARGSSSMGSRGSGGGRRR